MKSIRVRTKLWLEIDDRPLIGDGRAKLLREIAATGSINAACRELDLSYRKAWAQILEMERLAPFPVLEKVKGGKGGGGARLTPEALLLLQRFESLRDAAEKKLAGLRSEDIQLPIAEAKE